MLTILATTGRVLWMRWPMLLAWFLAGMLGRYVAIEASGFVGGYWETGGLLLLPLAVLARLTAYVGMFLVVRDGLRELSAIAPRPADPRERRAAFVQALLAGMLPFFAVYAAWGLLDQDTAEYREKVGEVRQGIVAWQLVRALQEPEGAPAEPAAASGSGIGFWTIAIIVIAFGLRMAWKRWESKLPKGLAVGAVYLETVWVFFFVWTLKDLTSVVRHWVSERAVVVWVEDVRAWLAERVSFVSGIWDGAEWLLGQLGAILLEPLAWLAVAGVIYGQAIAVGRVSLSSPYLQNRYIVALRRRYGTAPGWFRRRVKDVGDQLGSQVKPIGSALLLMWRAGPVSVASYVLLYVMLLAALPLLRILLIRAFGPQDYSGFWRVADTAVFLLIFLVTEPVRVALVAAGYDHALGALRRSTVPAASGRHAVTTGSAAVDGIVPPTVAPELSPEVIADQGSTGNRGNDG
ncbi:MULTISPECIES: hypothetical protein [Microbacterium]|uniref:hypothetical protein n=1 Tax=Microbacterium TaxID=33882 RepID=UPI00300F7FA5